MNKKKNHLFVICVFLSAIATSACTSERPPGNNIQSPSSGRAPVSLLDSSGTQHLLDILQSYYGLKDALTADNAAAADDHAHQLISEISLFPFSGDLDSLLSAEIQALLIPMDSALRAIVAVKDESCEYKRIAFRQVSDNLLLVIQAAGLQHITIYRQYCPMAFNDRGAYWLSEYSEIKNPYFGRKMAECGEISDILY